MKVVTKLCDLLNFVYFQWDFLFVQFMYWKENIGDASGYIKIVNAARKHICVHAF